jgi:hypothetical protein
MYRFKDASNLQTYISGKSLDPHSVLPLHDINATAAVDITKPCSLNVESLSEDAVLSSFRFNGGVFDARDQLVSTHLGERKSSELIGRKWHGRFEKGGLVCQDGLAWGDTSVALLPAIVGLATSVMSTGAVASWQTLNQVLGTGAGTAGVDATLMATFNSVHGGRVNSVRFIHRLAALFWHAVWTKHRGVTVVACNTPPTLTTIDSIQAIKYNVDQGALGRDFIPWWDPNARDANAVLPILYLAGSMHPIPVAGGKSRALKIWPSLNEVTLICENKVQVGALTNLRRITITPEMVWFTAVRWCSKYADLSLWSEAIEFVGTATISCHNGCALFPDSRCLYKLPASNMGCLALGLLLNPQSEMTLGTAPAMPAISILVENSYLKASLMGLCMWYQAWRIAGWFWHNSMTNATDMQEFCRRFLFTQHATGAWQSVQKHINDIVPGNLGRIFSTIAPYKEDVYTLWPGWNARVVQWEEMLGRLNKITPDAAIFGALYPLQPTRETFKRAMWSKVGSVIKDTEASSRPLDQVLASLAIWNGLDVAVIINEADMHLTSYKLNVLQNYRGVASDFQIMSGLDARGRTFYPMFKMDDRTSYTAMTDSESQRYHYKWWLELPEGAPIAIAHALLPAGPLPNIAALPAKPFVDLDYEKEKEIPDNIDVGSVSDSDDDGSAENTANKIYAEIDKEQRLAEAEMQAERDNPDSQAQPEHIQALEIILKRASDIADRTGNYRISTHVYSLHKNGVPVDICGKFAKLIVDGCPQPNRESPAYDAVKNIDIVDSLLPVDRLQRERMARHMASLFIWALGNTPGGTLATKMCEQYYGACAAARALHDHGALTSDEYLESKSSQGKREILANNPRSRFPTPQECKKLILAGYGVSQGLMRAPGIEPQLPDNSQMIEDDLEALISTLITSAWEANDTPDLEQISEIAGDAHRVNAVYNNLEAQRKLKQQALETAGSKNLQTELSGGSSSGAQVKAADIGSQLKGYWYPTASEVALIKKSLQKSSSDTLGPTLMRQQQLEGMSRLAGISSPDLALSILNDLGVTTILNWDTPSQPQPTPPSSKPAEITSTQQAELPASGATATTVHGTQEIPSMTSPSGEVDPATLQQSMADTGIAKATAATFVDHYRS